MIKNKVFLVFLATFTSLFAMEERHSFPVELVDLTQPTQEEIIIDELKKNSKTLAEMSNAKLVSAKDFYRFICACIYPIDKYNAYLRSMRQDPLFMDACFNFGIVLSESAQELYCAFERTPWVYYACQRAKIICKKALRYIALLAKTSTHNAMHEHIQKKIMFYDDKLSSWYTAPNALLHFFSSSEVAFDLAYSIWNVLIDEAETFSPDMQRYVLKCTYTFANTCIARKYIDEAFALISDILKKTYAQNDEFCAELRALQTKIYELLCSKTFRLYHHDFVAYYASYPHNEWVDFIINNYFSIIEYVDDESLRQMFEDIGMIYVDLERSQEFESLYKLAKAATTFKKWPCEIQENKILHVMKNFVGSYESLHANIFQG